MYRGGVISREKILIVEDEYDIALMVDTVMQEHGYRTVVAENGQRGLDLALEERPDLILLDLRLPEMRGLQLLYKLHEQDVRIPVVVVTAWGSEELAVQSHCLLNVGLDLELGRVLQMLFYGTKAGRFDQCRCILLRKVRR